MGAYDNEFAEDVFLLVYKYRTT